ncbi:MAG: hypothetical protein COA84_12725 [Robiginitomaculum sp.]|nr:MAG: hypothetical protein COA84_12725 [Robiginitomaculum sp.]
MSLTNFIKRPRIREAFGKYATKDRTPGAFKTCPLLVKDAQGPNGSAGTSFDYLARFHIARVMSKTEIRVHRRQWISEYVQERSYRYSTDEGIYDIGMNEEWHEYLTGAHFEANAYIQGKGNVKWLALLVQYMAHSDLLKRTMMGFDNRFDACGRVAIELIEMLELFDPIEVFQPKKHVYLNPEFVIADKVGGADAELIIDDRLIEIKTNNRLTLTKSTLLQLAGYVVLHDHAGIKMDDGVHHEPLSSVGIYFARHNKFVTIPLCDLFPDKGYQLFRDVFVDEIKIYEENSLKNQRLHGVGALEDL